MRSASLLQFACADTVLICEATIDTCLAAVRHQTVSLALVVEVRK